MTTNTTKALQGALEQALRDTGVSLQKSAADVAVYASQRAEHLATIAGQPGFDRALIAERDAVRIYAGRSSVREGDAADHRIHGIIEGGLAVLVGALGGA